jgi:UrcA family protein
MRAVISVAALAVVLGASAAAAQVEPLRPDVKTESAAVPYKDLDLTRYSDRATLEHRIDVATNRVCGDRPLAVEVRQQAQFSQCRAQVAAGAQQELAALYSRQGVATARLYVRPWPR